VLLVSSAGGAAGGWCLGELAGGFCESDHLSREIFTGFQTSSGASGAVSAFAQDNRARDQMSSPQRFRDLTCDSEAPQ
jgi:hypothetical protein